MYASGEASPLSTGRGEFDSLHGRYGSEVMATNRIPNPEARVRFLPGPRSTPIVEPESRPPTRPCVETIGPNRGRSVNREHAAFARQRYRFDSVRLHRHLAAFRCCKGFLPSRRSAGSPQGDVVQWEDSGLADRQYGFESRLLHSLAVVHGWGDFLVRRLFGFDSRRRLHADAVLVPSGPSKPCRAGSIPVVRSTQVRQTGDALRCQRRSGEFDSRGLLHVPVRRLRQSVCKTDFEGSTPSRDSTPP